MELFSVFSSRTKVCEPTNFRPCSLCLRQLTPQQIHCFPSRFVSATVLLHRYCSSTSTDRSALLRRCAALRRIAARCAERRRIAAHSCGGVRLYDGSQRSLAAVCITSTDRSTLVWRRAALRRIAALSCGGVQSVDGLQRHRAVVRILRRSMSDIEGRG